MEYPILMRYTLSFFERKEAEESLLLTYGFLKENDNLRYSFPLHKGDFLVTIIVKENRVHDILVTDTFSGEPYLLLDKEGSVGNYLLSLRIEYEERINDVLTCFHDCYCCLAQSERILNRIKEELHVSPSFPFHDKNNTIPVFMQEDGTWFGLILSVGKDSLYPGSLPTEVIDLKINPEKREELLKKTGFFPAYHMNKTHWISISLQDENTDSNIMDQVLTSYQLTEKPKRSSEWVFPSNPSIYPLEQEMDKHKTILWWRSKSNRLGDIVYLYSTLPDGCLLYKTKVTKLDAGYDKEYGESLMEITMIEKYGKDQYPMSLLREYGLTSIRGPRRIPEKLSRFLQSEKKK